MKKLTSYVVFERGYEYNDETYNAPESPGGDPKRVTFSKEDAIKLVKELNRESFRGLYLGQYCYEISEIVDDVETLKQIFKDNKWKWDEDEVTIPEKATNEQLDIVVDMINLSFFQYQEVELDIASMRNAQIERVDS